MNLRLGYMTGYYPRATDTFIQREVAMLRALGHHVQTFSVRIPAPSEQVSERIAQERKATIYLLPPRGLARAHLSQFVASPGRYAKAVRLAWRTSSPGVANLARQAAYFLEAGLLASYMRSRSLAHLHNHFADSSCSVAAIAAEMGGFTFSFTIHGPSEFFELSRWWLGEKVRRALFVICISSFCKSQVMIAASVETWKKLQIVHCGVDPDLFPLRRHEGRGRRLLYVGRLAPEKGASLLLETVVRLPDTKLDIIGDGPMRPTLEQLAAKLGIADRVVFQGYKNEREVRQALAYSDVFLMTSLAEGVPVVLMEALAAGVPPVAPRIGGIAELIEEGQTGLLVPPAEPEAAAQAVARLLEDPDLRNRMAVAGRDKVAREFNLDCECRRLAGIMTAALKCGAAGVAEP